MLSPGSTLGRFAILSKIGAGGMGEVYRARDERLGREVAIKVLPRDVADDAQRLARFEREARALASISHPNILPIFELGEAHGVTFAVTELLEGETLGERLTRGTLPWREAVDVAAAIADGLAAAHARGIVHRDIKPANVFLTRDGQVKVLDFGLAKHETPVDTDADTAAGEPPGTSPGTILGTVGYMAPEQVRGEPVDHRCDLFALGVLLHEALTGTKTFHRGTGAETVTAILTETPPEPAALGVGVPADLSRIVMRCLAKRAEDRFQSAKDLAFALRERQSGDAHRPPGPARAGDDRRSIAVLPFTNLSADRDQEYFCDGMAEEIINALAHVAALRVVARTSAFAFKGRPADIREIGARLDVETVLEGSVRKAGDQLRITAQLIDVGDGCHLWSGRFDRRLEDVFAIQEEIALAIVDHLKVKLVADEKATLVRRHTDDLGAHNAYLVGLFEWHKMTPEGFVRCQEQYRKAIRLDPGFAPAYAQLADSYTSATWWTDQPPAEALAIALPLLEKALALDPDLAHAHSVMGNCVSYYMRDWPAGEASLRRAVDLAPSNAFAQSYLATCLLMAGRGAEAAERARLAIRLDPLSPAISSWASVALVYSGHPAEGLAIIGEQVARTPHLWMPNHFLSVGLASQGRLDEARAAAERSIELSGGSSLTVGHLAILAYVQGDRAAGDPLRQQLEERAQAGYVPPMFRVFVELARGEPEAALHHAEAAGPARDPWIGPYRLYCPSIIPTDARVQEVVDGYLP